MDNLELLEQQHIEMQELIGRNQEQTENLLKGIIEAVSVEKSNDHIIEAIKQIKLPTPEVTVEPGVVNVSPIVNVNQEKVILSLENVADKIDGLKQKPVEKKAEKWEFNFVRNAEGFIIHATANQIK